MNLQLARKANLNRFVRQHSALAAGFVVVFALEAWLARSGWLLAAAVAVSAFFAVTRLVVRLVERNQLEAGALAQALGVLGLGISGIFIVPSFSRSVATIPLLALAIAMPHVRPRTLKLLVAGCGAQSFLALAVGLLQPRPVALVGPAAVETEAAIILCVVYLSARMLWQSSHLLGEARAAAEAARLTLEQAYSDLRVSEARYRTLLLATSDIVWTLDAEGRAVEPSPSWRAFTGQSGAEATDRGWLQAVHPADRSRVVGAWMAARKSGQKFEVDYRVRTGNGGYADMVVRAAPIRDEAGQIREWMGASTDVTERLQTAERLTQQTAVLTSFFESAPFLMGLVELDGERLAPVRLNRGVAELLREQGRALGVEGEALVEHPAIRALEARVLALARQAMESGAPAQAEFALERAGQAVTYAATFQAVAGAGERRQICFVAEDVTERRSFQQRLERSERLASLGQLAAGVAHEINNPLAYVRANLLFLREELAAAAPPDAREESATAFADALHGVDRIAQIVGDLKSFARDEREPSESCDPGAAVDEAVRLAKVRFSGALRLSVDLPAELPQVQAPQRRLGQVLLNLLVNAADAVEDARRDGLVLDAGEVRLIGRVHGDRLRFAVEDTGTGIPAAALPRLFHPFFTTKPPGKGTGLGLAICRELALRWGGELAVENLRPHGARFVVDVPLAAAEEAQLKAAS